MPPLGIEPRTYRYQDRKNAKAFAYDRKNAKAFAYYKAVALPLELRRQKNTECGDRTRGYVVAVAPKSHVLYH